MEAEIGLEIPGLDRIAAWTRTLVEHIHNRTTHDDELTLELLDILLAQIQRHIAELTNTP